MGINKITFSKYYELPGIIFDRLFNVFDEDNSEYLGLDQFINGMITLFSTDFDEMVKFVFKFYDKNNEYIAQKVGYTEQNNEISELFYRMCHLISIRFKEIVKICKLKISKIELNHRMNYIKL